MSYSKHNEKPGPERTLACAHHGSWALCQAARYQLSLMFMVAAVSAAAAVTAVHLAVRALVDSEHRLRAERLLARGEHEAGVAGFVHAEVAQVPRLTSPSPTHPLCDQCESLLHAVRRPRMLPVLALLDGHTTRLG